MELFIVRHAAAVERTLELPDPERPLTAAGRERFSTSVHGLHLLGVRLDLVLHSPWLRAAETAALLQPLLAGPARSSHLLSRAPSPDLIRELAHASSLCGACKDVCPVRIDIPRMLVELREHLDREKIAPWTERVVFKTLRRLLLSPIAYRLSATVGRWAQRPFVREGRLRGLPLVFGQWTKTRDPPPVAARTFRERWKELR